MYWIKFEIIITNLIDFLFFECRYVTKCVFIGNNRK